MSWLINNPAVALFMLQSNEAIARAVGGANGLQPTLQDYTGITGFFGQFFLILISMFGGFVHNYGLAIILTAIVVRLLLLPLTRMQIRGMKMQQQLQPVMKKIQLFYPNKQDQSAKTMELYSRFKINPLSGCLPMVIQLPILFGVYRALYDPSFAGKKFLGIQLLFPVNVTSGRSFGMGPELKDLIDVTIAKLGLMSQIVRLPDNIPLIGGSFWYLPALGLVVLYVLSSLLMQRTMRRVNTPDPEFAREFDELMKTRKPAAGAKPEPDMAQQMQRQMGYMNFIVIIFAFIFSAGALLYFVVQNVLMMLEYTLIPRYFNAGGVELNARELRDFIRQPPPPANAPNAGRRAGAEDGNPVPDDLHLDGDEADIESIGETTQEEAERPAAAEAAGAPRRPRKKRRKR